MLLSIRELELHKVHFDATYPPGEIDFSDLRQTGPLRATGSAELMGATEEIRVRGSLSVAVDIGCDRCLETVSFPIGAELDLYYRPDTVDGGEVALDEGESQVGFYQGDGLELEDILREQVLLALPMQRTCREDCKGFCPVCGRNRNQQDCGCRPERADDRWAALKNLKMAEKHAEPQT